jgi:hypothetical protein
MALKGTRGGRGPRITVQLDRPHQEFLRAHRRQYGVAASWIIRRLIENQMASGKDLLGKTLATQKPKRRRRARSSGAAAPAPTPDT